MKSEFKRGLILIPLCIAVLATSCTLSREYDGPEVEVRTFSTAREQETAVFTYGISSNRLLYVVLQTGKGTINNLFKGELQSKKDVGHFGHQQLELIGLTIDLPTSGRVFIVNNQKCLSFPLKGSLQELESKLKKDAFLFSRELLSETLHSE